MDDPAPYPKQTPQAAAPAAHPGETLPPAQAEALRQLRVLEDRYVNLRRKSQLTDENLLATEQKLQDELRSLTQELVELRRGLADVTQGMQGIEAEMQHAASIYDVKALEKYLSFWEPVQFVTQAELSRRRNLLKEPAGRQD